MFLIEMNNLFHLPLSSNAFDEIWSGETQVHCSTWGHGEPAVIFGILRQTRLSLVEWQTMGIVGHG